MGAKKKATASSKADRFNSENKVGTPVTRYALIDPLSIPMITKTKGLAYVSASGDAVIHVEGVSGYVLLESVEVLK